VLIVFIAALLSTICGQNEVVTTPVSETFFGGPLFAARAAHCEFRAGHRLQVQGGGNVIASLPDPERQPSLNVPEPVPFLSRQSYGR
jgi:hypothetical protein